METYSLEDEDYGDIFIMQTPQERGSVVCDGGDVEVMNDSASEVGDNGPIYEDITDDEQSDFQENQPNFK